jgi:hypothetical protein
LARFDAADTPACRLPRAIRYAILIANEASQFAVQTLMSINAAVGVTG